MGLQEDSNIMGVLSAWPGLSAHPCNSCRSASAALFCRSHSAYLCLTCDANIHDMRSCAPRHERVWVCEVCEQAPASVTCKADAAALCASCDRDIHSANPLARRHERVPVVPFFDSAAECVARSAASTATFLTPDKGVSDAGFKDEGGSDGWLIPNPSLDMDAFLGLDCELPNLQKIELEEMRSCHFGVTDSVVPTQSGGNSSFLFGNHESCFDIDFTRSKLSPFNYANHSISTSLTSSDIGVVPDGNLNSNSNSISEVTFTFTKPTRQVTNTDASTTANGIPMSTTKVSDMDRRARVLRYREKRKNRKFEKTIRYTSRKAYAEMRPRIKGRFAKRTDVNTRGDPLLGSESGSGSDIFSLDYGGYGVVPSS